ncbi:MAG: hypothetical protein AAGB29_10495 [Planctomycetota bacterium]
MPLALAQSNVFEVAIQPTPVTITVAAIFALGAIGLIWVFVVLPAARAWNRGARARVNMALAIVAILAIGVVFAAMLLAMVTNSPLESPTTT